MKKLSSAFTLCLIVFSALSLVGCGKAEARLSTYAITLNYFDATHTAECTTKVEYVNTSQNALKNLKFHIYPQAFSEGNESKVASTSSFGKTYPNGISYGGIEIESVKVGGKDSEWQAEDEGLEVPLESELFPDESLTIDFAYTLTLPNANHRFGYGEGFVNLANFYPIACVYKEGEGFCYQGYHANGDPFYSDVASYEVKICYDKNFTLAFSGDDAKTSEENGKAVTTFSAKKVRDVAVVLSDKMECVSGKAEGVEVKYYYLSDPKPQQSLETAVKAVEFYGEKFGKYPYSSLAVVETGFAQGGMEYPRLVMISNGAPREEYDYIIAHEVAHQWWYGVVGNDEYNEAWLDESLTEFSTSLFFKEHAEYGIDYSSLVRGAHETYNHFLSTYKGVQGEVNTSMARSLDEFNTEPEYVHNIYTRGVMMFDALKEDLGEKKLYKLLSGYYENFAYKNVTRDEFIDYFSSKSGKNLRGFFEAWLDGKVHFIEQ